MEKEWGFPGDSDGKESACNVGHLGLIPGWGRSSGEGNGHLLQYSRLENPIDRGAWWAIVRGMARAGQDLMAKPHVLATVWSSCSLNIFHLMEVSVPTRQLMCSDSEYYL